MHIYVFSYLYIALHLYITAHRHAWRHLQPLMFEYVIFVYYLLTYVYCIYPSIHLYWIHLSVFSISIDQNSSPVRLASSPFPAPRARVRRRTRHLYSIYLSINVWTYAMPLFSARGPSREKNLSIPAAAGSSPSMPLLATPLAPLARGD